MEAIYRISKRKMDNNVSTGLPITRDQVVEELVKCGYLDAAYTKEKFGNVVLNPATDPNIVGADGHLHRRGVQRGRHGRQRVPQDGLGHEDGHRRLRGRRLHHDGRLRLPRRHAPGRRDEGLPRGPLHGRGPRVRRAHGQAA